MNVKMRSALMIRLFLKLTCCNSFVRKAVSLLFLFIHCFGITINAQVDSVKYLPKPDKAYFLSYLPATKKMFFSPSHWEKKQWVTFAAVGTGLAGIMTQDANVRDFAQRNKTEDTKEIVRYGLEPWGTGLYSIPALGLFYLVGTIAKDERSRETALLGVQAFIVSGVYTGIIKEVFHRHRPYLDDGPYIFEGPFSGFGNHSFPSGHSELSFAVATIVASEYHDKRWVQVVAYSLAGLTALSRIHDDRHWASDVVTGAALGIANGRLIYKLNSKTRK